MRFSRQHGMRRRVASPIRARPGMVLALCMLPVAPAAADTLDVADPVPPPGTYFSAYVADSATGRPLAGAPLNIRNVQALFTVTQTDSGGWAHVPPSGLPSSGNFTTPAHWVTAAYPGYVAQMETCSTGTSGKRVLRFTLPRATAKNSLTFTGTLIDSATQAPIPRMTMDISHSEKGGWMTYLTTTDDSGKFSIPGIPLGHSEGYFWVRKPNRSGYFLSVSLTQGGKPIVVPGLSPTALAAPGNRKRASMGRKSARLMLFQTQGRDAVGRRSN